MQVGINGSASNLTKVIFCEAPPKAHNFVDITGRRFGDLVVTRPVGRQFQQVVWECRCDCGNLTHATKPYLQTGKTRSCGCFKLGVAETFLTVHGEGREKVKTREFRIYCDARNRCENPRNRNYYKYGKRGIEFRFDSYQEFLAAVGRCPSPDYSLDRIDNNGHYEVGNLRWATRLEQANNKRNNRRLVVDGVTHTIPEWSRLTGIKSTTIHRRTHDGFCAKCAVTNPVRVKCVHKETR